MSNDPKQNDRLDHPDLGAIFDKHVKCEFEDHDVDATMKTMVRAVCTPCTDINWRNRLRWSL
ncbi:MAG TPA: hypothetical protein VKA91_11685 [Nitrososphaeraceae archaeon]|nr:hypothetical protein [Nitrososphaeraceae archaeon]